MARSVTSVWPPLPPWAHLQRPRAALPYPLDDAAVRLFSRARNALSAGLTALGIGPGDRVLAPAWHHGSEIEAIVATGAECVFYDAWSLPSQVERLLTPTVRALHLTHYLGLPQDSGQWRRWCDAHGLLLVEDAAQAWLAERDDVPVGATADLAVFCLYKTYGLPDGAALVARVDVPRPPGAPGGGGPAVLRRHAAWMAQHVRMFSCPVRAVAGPYDADADFALGSAAPPSRATLRLLARLASPDTAHRRRQNYRVLLEALGPFVPPPFDVLPDGAAPFAFPIAVTEKLPVLAALRAHGIRALDFWSVPHPLLPETEFPLAAWLRRHLVALPVHQELGTRQVREVARTASAAIRRASPRTATHAADREEGQ
jgi:dTDP-4-amino-4,6-dideoxygalactose transaminase